MNKVKLLNTPDIGEIGLIKQINEFFTNTKIFKNIKVKSIKKLNLNKNPDWILTLSKNVKHIDFKKANKIFPDLIKI